MKLKWLFTLLCLSSGLLLLGGCSEEEPPPLQPVATRVEQVSEPETEDEEYRDDSEAITQPGYDDRDASSGAPRVVAVKLEPVPAFPGSVLTAVAESEDPDGDLVTYRYQWLRNNEPVEGEFEEFDTSGMLKGDLIAVEVTPSDGENDGELKKSLPVLLHNRPPEITSFPTGMVEGRFVYQLDVEDPDGDTFSYALEGAPEGMEIDPESGLIDWQVPDNLNGSYQVKILVSDGDATSYQTFSLNFSPQ